MKKLLWVYSKPNTMVGHRYSDDVALVRASSAEEALNKFKKLYNVNIEDIHLVVFNAYDIAILTDY